jgi:glutamate-1-semialdehyde 2,1-aminomutase
MATVAPQANLDVDTALGLAERRYADAHPKSRAQIERAKRSMPGGNTRTILFFQPFPVVIKRSEGCRIWDIDDNVYVDFLGEYTAGLFGHSDPTIKAAIQGALDTGWVHGGHIESETVLAEAVCARFPSIERVRFTNSGTEANLMAITTARLHTKRDKVMVMRGGYHGGVLLFKTGSIPQNAPYPYVLGAYNDAAATVKTIEANAKELACVLLEPMQGSSGCIPADPAFLAAVREACTKHGIILIFDEVMTSRLAPGGLQERHGVIPDMTTLGKYVGGGCSFGAFGGRTDVMAIYDPYRADAIAHAGTFNNNAMTMAAGVAAMTLVYTPARAMALNESGDILRARLNGEAAKRGLPVQVTGLGSMMSVHFRDGDIRNSDDASASSDAARGLFHIEMLERGFHCARRGMINLSLPMGQAEFDGLVAAFGDFLDAHARVIRSLPQVV